MRLIVQKKNPDSFEWAVSEPALSELKFSQEFRSRLPMRERASLHFEVGNKLREQVSEQ
jgi:hypothetical protein